jgi:hypothetical protein
VHRILGQVEASEQADERREDSAGFRSEHGVEMGANLVRGRLGHAGEKGKRKPAESGKNNGALAVPRLGDAP